MNTIDRVVRVTTAEPEQRLIAALLHVAMHADNGAAWTITLKAETAEAAVDIGRYLLAHAQAVYGRIGADADIANAEKVLRWILAKADSVYASEGS